MLLLNKAVLSSFDFRYGEIPKQQHTHGHHHPHTSPRYPIFLTACHQACGTLMSMFFSTIGCMPRQRITSRKQLYKIAVLATVFCASIVSNNASMRYIAVSFNQACSCLCVCIYLSCLHVQHTHHSTPIVSCIPKTHLPKTHLPKTHPLTNTQAIGATTPAITAVMAYFMLNTRESRQTYMTLVPVVLGIIVASGWEPNFNMLGFLLCLTATTTRSFKTVLQALLLSDPAERLSSMSLMYYMSPIALAVSLPLALLFEDAPWVRAAALMQANPKFAWAFVANVLLSYCINLTNFLATQYTSALTIQVG